MGRQSSAGQHLAAQAHASERYDMSDGSLHVAILCDRFRCCSSRVTTRMPVRMRCSRCPRVWLSQTRPFGQVAHIELYDVCDMSLQSLSRRPLTASARDQEFFIPGPELDQLRGAVRLGLNVYIGGGPGSGQDHAAAPHRARVRGHCRLRQGRAVIFGDGIARRDCRRDSASVQRLRVGTDLRHRT